MDGLCRGRDGPAHMAGTANRVGRVRDVRRRHARLSKCIEITMALRAVARCRRVSGICQGEARRCTRAGMKACIQLTGIRRVECSQIARIGSGHANPARAGFMAVGASRSNACVNGRGVRRRPGKTASRYHMACCHRLQAGRDASSVTSLASSYRGRNMSAVSRGRHYHDAAHAIERTAGNGGCVAACTTRRDIGMDELTTGKGRRTDIASRGNQSRRDAVGVAGLASDAIGHRDVAWSQTRNRFWNNSVIGAGGYVRSVAFTTTGGNSCVNER